MTNKGNKIGGERAAEARIEFKDVRPTASHLVVHATQALKRDSSQNPGEQIKVRASVNDLIEDGVLSLYGSFTLKLIHDIQSLDNPVVRKKDVCGEFMLSSNDFLTVEPGVIQFIENVHFLFSVLDYLAILSPRTDALLQNVRMLNVRSHSGDITFEPPLDEGLVEHVLIVAKQDALFAWKRDRILGY